MSRNSPFFYILCTNMLEKPVLFDVTERVHITNIFLLPVLEKPVLFDVTEPISAFRACESSSWKSRFYLMSRNSRLCSSSSARLFELEKPVLFDVTEPVNFQHSHSTLFWGWKSRFYLMSRNRHITRDSSSRHMLEKPVLFDVTEQVFNFFH